MKSIAEDYATLTREEIYNLVWSHPLSNLAKKYHISDVGLRKMCKRMNIPLPTQGHWLRQRFKKDINRMPLSQNNSVEQKVELRLRNGNNIDATPSREAELQSDIEQDLHSELTIGFELAKADPLVLAAQKSLTKRDKYYKEGTLLYAGELGIGVGPLNIDRALLIMDRLVKALKKRGHKLSSQKAATVIVGEEEIDFSLKESQTKVLVADNGWERKEFRPNGILILKFEANWMSTSIKDGKLKIESQLSKIIARVELLSERLKVARLEREEWHRNYQEQRRLENELKNRKANEVHGIKHLLQDARRWKESQVLRDYISGIERKATERGTLTDELQNWLEWARHKADWYDPLIELEDEWLKDLDRDSLLSENKIIAGQSQNTWNR